LTLLPVGLALLALGLYIKDALALVAYPFDWDPGEGLVVDAALRLRAHGLRSLYPTGDVVPTPFTYGPLLPALLALVPGDDVLLTAGRGLGLAFALAAAGAVYALVRKQAARSVALAFAALSLAPANRTYWLALVRVDAAMIACWMWAGVFLLPQRLARGSERLPWPRATAGALFLVLAVLAKPVAVVIGAPLLLAWLVVDLRSAARAALVTALLGGVAFAALELATSGGFWRTLAFQALAETIAGQTSRLVRGSLVTHAGMIALTAVGVAMAAARRDGSVRDGTWMLWLAGPLVVPMLAKAGAIFNYLLPWATGQAALAGRLCGPVPPPSSAFGRKLPGSLLGATVAAVLALSLMLGGFPLPTAVDRRTAESFYGFIAVRGGPLFAVHPDLAYVYAREPVLVEMAMFPVFYRHRLPGARQVFERLDRQEFRTVVENLDRWTHGGKGYATIGACELGFHYGRARLLLMVPLPEAPSVDFRPLPGSRCLAPMRGP
jgi:hypothetical protein